MMKIKGYLLDSYQEDAVFSDCKNILLLAGAGTGKTFTIVGKIKYLVDIKKIKEEEILCISYTNDAVSNMKDLLALENLSNVCVFTFHKLAYKIIKDNFIDNKTFKLINFSNLISYIIDEFFLYNIFYYPYLMRLFLKYFHITFFFSLKKSYLKIVNSFKFSAFKKLLINIISLHKSNGKVFMDFLKIKEKIYNESNVSDRIIIVFALIIYYIYEVEIESINGFDFDKLLMEAKEILNENIKYKYVLVDEFQDTSHLRFTFLRAILNKSGASLFAVGDDYQSIYHFSGCDLNLFLNFESLFEDSVVKNLSKTYRNSQELINVASDFIMKNKKQMKKNLLSEKRNNKPIKIVFSLNKEKAFEKIIKDIKTNVMVLGRNTFDINYYINSNFKILNNKIIYSKDLNKAISYYTVHSSKGLEEENVLILNNEDALYGFPNKLEESSILKYFSKPLDYLYEEERRLFYVALTRTKNNVYLFTSFNISCFIKELLSDYSSYIEKIFV